MPHLRHIAVRRPATWMFRVISDAELVTAWLASVPLQGGEIIDADAYKVSTKYMTIPDLVSPPDLVILRMGVKVARNEAASEVLAEAINTRLHERKPTWFWEDPLNPLTAGHLFYSREVERSMSGWEVVGEPFGTAGSSGGSGNGGDKPKGRDSHKKGSNAPDLRIEAPSFMRNKTLRGRNK